MGRRQRIGFLVVAVVIAIVAVVLISGDGATDTADAPTPEPTRSAQEASPADASATPEPTATADPVRTLAAGKVTKLTATEGDRVRFRVRSDAPEEIHVHGYDIEREVPAGRPLDVAFEADITGVFEVELHGSGEQIGRLTVQPR